MTKIQRLLICLTLLGFGVVGNVGSCCYGQDKRLSGNYSYYPGYDHFSLILNQDSTFEQQNGSHTWDYLAIGKWQINSDTILLKANKLYSVHGDGKKTLQTDTSSGYYKMYFMKMNKYLIKPDTMDLIWNSNLGSGFHIVKLARSISLNDMEGTYRQDIGSFNIVLKIKSNNKVIQQYTHFETGTRTNIGTWYFKHNKMEINFKNTESESEEYYVSKNCLMSTTDNHCVYNKIKY